MLPSEYKKMKRMANKKPKTHRKIANTFIENAIANSNLSALKTIYYLSTIFEKIDMSKMQNNKIVGIKIDKREMLKYTELSADTIIKTVKSMQKTSITFVDDDGVIEGMSLLPRYRFVPNRNIVELDLYVRIAKMIIEVKEKYTMMDIKELMRLKRPHSVRMLALLNRIATYKDKNGKPLPKRKVFTLDNLREFFGVNLRNWNEFERKIIKPIQEELDNNASKSFIYEANYEVLGRGRPSFKDVTIDVVTKKRVQPALFK